jgi:hypothetical protein
MQFDKKKLSPMAIASELQEAVSNMPDAQSWNNYFEGGAGRTIIELIAGSQAIKNHYNLMRVRESSLQFAKLDSSITELAINKGVYRPPAKSLKLEITFIPRTSGHLKTGDIIGSYKNYNLIVLEPVSYVYSHNAKVLCTVGKVDHCTFDILDPQEFHQIEIRGQYRYFSSELQELTVNGQIVNLVDEELNLYDERLKNSAIRLTYDFYTKLIFGDGVVGKKINIGDKVTFKYNTFGEDMIENFKDSRVSISADILPGDIIGVVELRKATKLLDKEILRKIAIRNSVDGRWVQVEDYRNGLLREFGEYMYDVLVKDEYPRENITILPKEDYISDEVKREIKTLINNKRGNATLIDLDFLDPYSDQRLELTFNFQYIGTDSNEELDNIIAGWVEERLNRIRYSGYKLTGADVAVELTHLSPGGKFYADLTQEYFIDRLNSIKKITINYIR